jgi:hypothetical protein
MFTFVLDCHCDWPEADALATPKKRARDTTINPFTMFLLFFIIYLL